MTTPTRWGLMGCGNIANDFATAMTLLSKVEHEIVAVAGLDFEETKKFADKFHVRHAFKTSEDVANCPDVDIVYVAVTNTAHLQCVKLALNAGKSVLCEAPMGMNGRQVREMIQLSRQKGVFFMEAFNSRCCPIYEEIRQALKDGRIGEPKFLQGLMGIETHESFNTGLWYSEHPFKKEAGEGAMLYFGCYMIMLTTMLFDGQRPESIKATGKLDSQGVDLFDCVTLKYKNGAVAQLMMSAEVLTEQRVVLFGTKGSMELPELIYCPSKVIVNSKLIELSLPDAKETEYIYPHYQALSYEIQHIRECLSKGLKESPLMSLEQSDVIVSITDEIRRQVGCVYPDSL